MHCMSMYEYVCTAAANAVNFPIEVLIKENILSYLITYVPLQKKKKFVTWHYRP